MKRIYDAPSDDDGRRVLVDRLWPRGITREAAALDEWCKAVTPSNELRKWLHENPDERWQQFRDRYIEELAEAEDEIKRLVRMADDPGLTLLTAAKNGNRNHVVVLTELLRGKR